MSTNNDEFSLLPENMNVFATNIGENGDVKLYAQKKRTSKYK